MYYQNDYKKKKKQQGKRRQQKEHINNIKEKCTNDCLINTDMLMKYQTEDNIILCRNAYTPVTAIYYRDYATYIVRQILHAVPKIITKYRSYLTHIVGKT